VSTTEGNMASKHRGCLTAPLPLDRWHRLP
jgi:hypothetical protein